MAERARGVGKKLSALSCLGCTRARLSHRAGVPGGTLYARKLGSHGRGCERVARHLGRGRPGRAAMSCHRTVMFYTGLPSNCNRADCGTPLRLWEPGWTKMDVCQQQQQQRQQQLPWLPWLRATDGQSTTSVRRHRENARAPGPRPQVPGPWQWHLGPHISSTSGSNTAAWLHGRTAAWPQGRQDRQHQGALRAMSSHDQRVQRGFPFQWRTSPCPPCPPCPPRVQATAVPGRRNRLSPPLIPRLLLISCLPPLLSPSPARGRGHALSCS